VTRRVPGRRAGTQTFAYAKELTPLMCAFVFVSLIELPIVHLLIPWDTVRLVADIVSIWGLLWMIGLLASVRVFPHLLDERELRVRYGASTDVRVPRDAIASVRARRGKADDPGRVPVMNRTNIAVTLKAPVTIGLTAW